MGWREPKTWTWRQTAPLSVLVVALIAGVLAAALQLVIEPPEIEPESHRLTETENTEVFGVGKELGVTRETPSGLRFVFDYRATDEETIHYVRFEPRGIATKEQLKLSLNGFKFAYLSRRSDDSKLQRLRLPKQHLKAGATNELVFERAGELGAPETWAIAKARLVVRRSERALGIYEAQRSYDRFVALTEQSEPDAEHLVEARQHLETAILILMSVDPKPDLYDLASATLKDLAERFDRQCQLSLEASRQAAAQREFAKASMALEQGLKYFPEEDSAHPCRQKLLDELAKLPKPSP
ncbi:MAG TPA: hypothetical protein VGK67_25320 [Myxococcales bacterium]|jgi:hypothetical protein